jgi:cytochrome c oxidase cbb3-type subunit I
VRRIARNGAEFKFVAPILGGGYIGNKIILGDMEQVAVRSGVVYEDRPVKQLLYPALIFLLVGLFIGIFISYNGFLRPDSFAGEYIHFGRVRPVHVTTVTLLWLLSADMALMYFFVPRLCGTPLWSLKLATLTNSLWWFGLILGAFSIPFGTNFGWEYAELPMTIGRWIPIKGIVAVAWALFAFNLFMTIGRRKYQKMYVALWYVMGTLI